MRAFLAIALLMAFPGEPEEPASRTVDLRSIAACHNRGAVALALAAHSGRKSGVARQAVQNCLGDISRPPPGSGNWPVHLAAALHLAGQEDGHALLPWLLGTQGWHHNGHETGSPLYESSNVAAALELHRRSPDHQIRAAAGRWLRALWARMALTTAPRPQTLEICIAGRCQTRKPKERDWTYRGPWSYRPGERALRNPGAGGWGVHWDVDPLQPALGAALDLPRHLRLKRAVPSAEDVTLATLLYWTFDRHGVDLKGSNPPHLFGLTPTERDHLVRFVQEPSAAHARRIVPYLEGYGDPREMVIARFANDALAVFWSGWSRNGNKPAAPLVVRRPSGAAVYGVPSRWRSVGASRSRAVWDREAQHLRGESRDPAPEIAIPLEAFGPPTLILRLATEGLVVETGGPP